MLRVLRIVSPLKSFLLSNNLIELSTDMGKQWPTGSLFNVCVCVCMCVCAHMSVCMNVCVWRCWRFYALHSSRDRSNWGSKEMKERKHSDPSVEKLGLGSLGMLSVSVQLSGRWDVICR